MKNDPREILSSALSLWWLRPENGLAIASYCHNGYDFAPKAGQKAADYACGDGVNTFFKCGGRFDASFDVFGAGVSRQNSQEIIEKKIDVFDHFDDDYEVKISNQVDTGFSYGTDHKQNLLRKAQKLDFYENLLEANLNDDTAIPDESLDIAYCNSLYWVAKPEVAIDHIYRKLKKGGVGVFDVMTDHRKALQFQLWMPNAPTAWQELMNRGREANNPGIRSEDDWRIAFEANGSAKIEEVRNIFPATIAFAWNIGLRPIFPVLNRMVESLTPENRQSIKEDWVEIWTDMLLPMLEEPTLFSENGIKPRLQYVVQKK